MRKIRMCADVEKTFAEGVEAYILDCKARDLRDGTIRHCRGSIRQIYKRVPADTLIIPLNEDIIKILQEYLKYCGSGTDDRLFCSIYGEKRTKGRTILRCGESGGEVRPGGSSWPRACGPWHPRRRRRQRHR